MTVAHHTTQPSSAWTTNASADTPAGVFRLEAASWAKSQQQLILLAADIDESGCWLADGHTTAASWIAAVADIEACTAREWLRISHRLHTLPLITQAYVDGELSYAKVRTLTRLATTGNEGELLPVAHMWPAAELGRALAVWLRNNEDPDGVDQLQRERRAVRLRVEPDGMHRAVLNLLPDIGGGLLTALETKVMRTTPRAGEPWPSLAQQYADAFEELLQDQTKQHVEVVVHVDEDGARFDSGAPLTSTAFGRLLDGAFIRALIHTDQRTPIDATNKRRHPTTRQKRVVSARDGGCVDCGRTNLINFDHQPAFDITRHTITTELQQRCAPCHHKRS